MNLASNITPQNLTIFLQEADEMLQLLDEDIVRLEREDSNSDLINEIFRAAHTLKGSSAMVGHQRMSKVAHAMESVLDGVRKGTLAVTPKMVDTLLNSLDILKILKEELVTHQESEVDISVVISLLESITGNSNTGGKPGDSQKQEKMTLSEDARTKLKTAQDTGQSAYIIKVSIDRNSSWAAVRSFQLLSRLSTMGELLCSAPTQKDIEEGKVGFDIELLLISQHDEVSIRNSISQVPEITSIEVSHYSLEKPVPVSVEKQPFVDTKTAQKTAKMAQTVRIDVSRLDSLMEQIGELVVNRNRINQLSKMLESKYKGDNVIDDLGRTSVQIGKIVNTLQQDIMKIRMLPIEIVFNGFPRMVRDLARKADKNIDFIIEGQETEVDRSVIEHIKDPLVHLLRNAVDHGIETAEKRRAVGKPETAIIKLTAYHEQNHIVITVEDDGKGLDPDAIKNSAIRKGLISIDAAERLTDAEAIDLMFTPGISTAEKATEVSGRGVGLDVVKTNIEALNGSVITSSKIGKGTKFTLLLPLTLAILPSLLISAGSMLCAIPLANIVETTKLGMEDIQTVRGRRVSMLRGSTLPVLSLAKIFGLENETSNHDGTAFVVVIKAGETQAGLVVDSLIEQQEIVIKSLGNYFGGIKGVAGASILGDGRVALIIDIATMIQTIIAENRQNRTENVYVTA